MFKVQVKSINPSTPPRPYGGTSSLIPADLAIDGERAIQVTIAIESDQPDKSGKTTYGGEDKALISEWLPDQYGMYGKTVGDAASPINLVWQQYRAQLVATHGKNAN
jgi:hypothetical protein